MINSLLSPIVESTYLNISKCKRESSQKAERRTQSPDSSKAYRKPWAFNCNFIWVEVETLESNQPCWNVDQVVLSSMCHFYDSSTAVSFLWWLHSPAGNRSQNGQKPTSLMLSLIKNSNQNFFVSLQTQKLVESFEGLNNSLAQLTGKLWSWWVAQN